MAGKKQIKTKNIELDNSLSIFDIASLHKKLLEAYSNSDQMEVDLHNVTSCDTAGIQLLYSLRKSSIEDGKELTVINPSGAVKEVLDSMCIPLNTIL